MFFSRLTARQPSFGLSGGGKGKCWHFVCNSKVSGGFRVATRCNSKASGDFRVAVPTYRASHDSLHVILKNVVPSVRCPPPHPPPPPATGAKFVFYMVPGTCASHLVFLYWPGAHLRLKALCCFTWSRGACASKPCVCLWSRGTLAPQHLVFLDGLVPGHTCASTPCVFIWSLGTLVPQHLVFLDGPGAHLCLNTLFLFYTVLGHTCA